jgi:hypothetical protein
MRRSSLLVVMSALVVALAVPAADAATPTVVSANPADNTPHVLNGAVEAVARVGHTVVLGGTFTQVQNQGQSTTLTRNALLAYDETTGKVSATFVPVVGPAGKIVTSIVPTGDGTSVYIGGSFTTINGITTGRIARVDVTTGQLVPGFKAARPNATVNSMELSKGRLIVAGQFTKMTPPGKASQVRGAIASLDPTTGALTTDVTDTFRGIGTKGTTAVSNIDVTPAGDQLVAIGNFSSVDGQPRSLIAQLDISGATSSLAAWNTSQFPAFDSSGATWCSKAFPSYMRDVSYSPDGTWFAVVTTGAFRAGRLCDTQTRWETDGGINAMPTWVDWTGGDTTTAVQTQADGRVIYVGGHFRWLNNPFTGDKAGAGAVPRVGLAAIDSRNGLPYSWNPTRERGYGVYDFLSAADGLFVGSDTDQIGGEYHPRIGFFPMTGGFSLPTEHVAALPAEVYLLGRTSGSVNDLRHLSFTGTTSGALTTTAGTESWGSARGSFAVDDQIYTGWSDGTLTVRTFNGSTFGAVHVVPMSFPDTFTTGGMTPANNFVADLPKITGMFYDPVLARLYYTQAGSSSLYYRYFEPQSQIVGAQKFTATGNTAAMSPGSVNGMFLAGGGGRVYFSDGTGTLKSIAYANGSITGASATTANTSIDWRTHGMFAWDGG